MNHHPLPWHQPLWQTLLARTRAGTLPHGLLLKGASGLGKQMFAQAFTAWLLCHRSAHDQPCGQCKGCALTQSDNHPDSCFVAPEADGKPIRVDQIRAVTRFARQTAQQGGRRVIVINPAEAMNVNAANSLLKCLEEPGGETVFMLISSRPADLLPTVRSRCQTVTFTVPDRAQARAWLAEYGQDDAGAVDTLLTMAAHAPLKALAFAEQGLLGTRKQLIAALSSLFRGELTPVELAKTWQGKPILILEWLADWLGDTVKWQLTGDPQAIHNQDLTALLQYLAGKAPPRMIMTLRDWLMGQRQVLLSGGNLNSLLLLEGVFCRYLALVV